MPRTASSDIATRLVGQEIRKARQDAGLTLAAVCARLETTVPYLANVEAGRVNVTVGQLARIADAIGCDLQVAMPQIEIALSTVNVPRTEAMPEG